MVEKLMGITYPNKQLIISSWKK